METSYENHLNKVLLDYFRLMATGSHRLPNLEMHIPFAALNYHLDGNSVESDNLA
jgi:hypothetical protein